MKNPIELNQKEKRLVNYMLEKYPNIVQWFLCEGYAQILNIKIQKQKVESKLPKYYKDKLIASVRDTGETIQGTYERQTKI